MAETIAAYYGRAVREVREGTGLRQADLAHVVNAFGFAWTQAIVSNVERGVREMAMGELIAVCVALRTTPAALFNLAMMDSDDPTEIDLGAGRTTSFTLARSMINNMPRDWLVMAAPATHPGPDHVDYTEVLELADTLAGDPDAHAIAEVLLTDIDIVQHAHRQWYLNERLPQMGLHPLSAHDRIRVSDTIAALAQTWETQHRSEHPAETIAPRNRRAVRAALCAELANAIRPYLPEDKTTS